MTSISPAGGQGRHPAGRSAREESPPGSAPGSLARSADISFGVIHNRAKRPVLARRSEVVNNCAAKHNSARGRPVLARSRFSHAYPRRVSGRLTGEPVALAPTSNRKTPQEGPRTSEVFLRGRRLRLSRLTQALGLFRLDSRRASDHGKPTQRGPEAYHPMLGAISNAYRWCGPVPVDEFPRRRAWRQAI